jgi:hypothetical protein
MKLRAFREKLEKLTKKNDAVRPFVCSGSPYDCKAFVVGINAASDVPFWCYWDDEKGFCKERWYDRYRAERERVSRKPISPTRQRLNRIVCAAAPVKILETNLFSVATQRAVDLQKKDKLPDVLEFLLCEVFPNVLLLHGKVVREYFECLCGYPLTCSFSSAAICGKTVKIAAVRQLAYVSYEKASQLGETIGSLGAS